MQNICSCPSPALRHIGWKQPYDVIDLTKESVVNVVRVLDLQYIWRAGELLPVRRNEDDAVSAKQQCREKTSKLCPRVPC